MVALLRNIKEADSTKSWKKQFAIIYAGQAFSLIGSATVQFAIIWWLTVQTESAVTLTLASIFSFLPNLVIGPFAGVIIDRYNRRTVMIAADGLVATASTMLGAVFLLNPSPPIWLIYFILFIRGLGNTFHGPAMQAAIPTLMPTEMLTKAGGWGNLISSLANMLGPVLGAALLGLLPLSGIMLVDIAGAVFAIVCLLFVRIPDIPRASEKVELLSNLKQGLLAMRENKPFMAAFVPLVFNNLLYMPLVSLLPLLVRTQYLGGSIQNSVVQFAYAAGLLVSSSLIALWGGMKKRFAMIGLAIGAVGAVTLLSGILPSGGFWAFVICCFVMGGAGTFIGVPFMAYAQESFPPEKLGKVFSMWFTTMSLAMPVGLLAAGPISEAVGVGRWFFVSGIALLGVAAWFRARTRACMDTAWNKDSAK